MCLAGASLSEEHDANLNIDIGSLFGFWIRREEVGLNRYKPGGPPNTLGHCVS